MLIQRWASVCGTRPALWQRVELTGYLSELLVLTGALYGCLEPSVDKSIWQKMTTFSGEVFDLMYKVL